MEAGDLLDSVKFSEGIKKPSGQDHIEKLKVMNDFKAAIEALPAKIGFIRHIFVGLNANSAEKWDICLDSEFDTLADVNAYAVHPDHVAAAGLLKEVKADRACVDYEF